jgi:hypothetical protein
VGKPDFRVGDFHWFYEREMGRSTSLVFWPTCGASSVTVITIAIPTVPLPM